MSSLLYGAAKQLDSFGAGALQQRLRYSGQTAGYFAVSPRVIEQARATHGSPVAMFVLRTDYEPRGEMDLAFCNGVFHHIPPPERLDALDYVSRSLRAGGLFAFWENNPWNPATRFVMSRIPFDRDAITISPIGARRLLADACFDIVRTDHTFFFPRALRLFRRFERRLTALPLGAQYLMLARKRRWCCCSGMYVVPGLSRADGRASRLKSV